jgi:hypothetical protein
MSTTILPDDFRLSSLVGIVFSFGPLLFIVSKHSPSSSLTMHTFSYCALCYPKKSKAVPASLRCFCAQIIALLTLVLAIGEIPIIPNTLQVAAYSLCTCIYNLYFHPLSHIPGPFWARATPIPYILGIRYGNMVPWVHELHQKYGDVIRVAPRECSFISADTAWQDIYGFRTGRNKGGKSFQKDRNWYPVPYSGSRSILSANDADHSRMRKNLSHAFSDRALRDQESLVQKLIVGRPTTEMQGLLLARLSCAHHIHPPCLDLR